MALHLQDPVIHNAQLAISQVVSTLQGGFVASAPVVGHVRRAGWTRISRGVHLPNQAVDSLVFRAGAWAAVLPETAVVTHLSAAALRGWWLPRTLPDLPFFVAMPRKDPRPRRRGLHVVRHKVPPSATRLRGLCVASPAETLLACARDLGTLDLVVLIDSALHTRDCSLDQLTEIAGQPRRGAPRLREAVRLGDPRSESAGETLLRVLHVACSVPVTAQFVIQDDAGHVLARADLRIEATMRLPEYDGAYHRDATQYERDRARDRLLRTHGWDPYSYSAVSVFQTPIVILRDADNALGREHDPDRLDAWRKLWTESSYSADGKLRLRRRFGPRD
ncbi:MAG: hypothetical protein H0T54_01785 [Geodermatophilaceae bacterium]|nr:hypothetical protein [Geodermatophilaceae bacterium]